MVLVPSENVWAIAITRVFYLLVVLYYWPNNEEFKSQVRKRRFIRASLALRAVKFFEVFRTNV